MEHVVAVTEAVRCAGSERTAGIDVECNRWGGGQWVLAWERRDAVGPRIGEAVAGGEAIIAVGRAVGLAGTELAVDDWQVDICVSVGNKGLASQPGLAAITVSPLSASGDE